MAVIAAHAAVTKSTSPAHGAQGAQGSAVPADETALFAQLLSEAGDGSDSANNDTKAAGPEAQLAAQKPGEKSKKDKDVTDAMVPGTADIQMQPSQLAMLSAALSTDAGQTPSPANKAANDNSDAVTPADDAKALLNRMLDAKTEAPAGNPAPAKDAKNAKTATAPDAVDATANANAAPTANATNTNAPKAPDAETKVADATQTTNATVQQALSEAAKTPNDKTDKIADSKTDAKTASKDAAQASAPSIADALAAAADKSVRQSAATQGSQARAVPMQADAQAASSQHTGSNDAGTNGKDSSPSQHAKNDADTQPKPDAVQPASQAPVNTGSAPQPAPHVQAATDNVQPLTAQVQTQTTSPAVTASLQVAPQTAQHAAQPDVTGLAVQIAAKSDEGIKHFDIRLDPPELGRVDVKLSINDAGQAQAHLTVEKPQTLDLLQNDRSSLERALKDSGVDLSQNGLNFSLKGQDRQSGNPQGQSSKSRNLAVTAAIEATTAAVAASTNSYAAGDARLDIRV